MGIVLRSIGLAGGLVLAMASQAQTKAADKELDALDLKAEPTTAAADARPKSTHFLVEAAAGHSQQRYGLGGEDTYRLSLDWRYTARLGSSTRLSLSDRLDHVRVGSHQSTINTVREAYVGWQDDAAITSVEVGRVNVRTGPAYGYNPTDFFRDGALRSTTTLDPLALRDNRMGVAVVRAQRLWGSGAIAFIYAPKITETPGTSKFSLDLGSTNYAHRAQISLSQDLAKGFSAQFLAYKSSVSNLALGTNVTALVNEYVVGHAEFTYSREQSLLDRAIANVGAPERRAARAVIGATAAVPGGISLTVELQHNGFALSKSRWDQLAAANSFASLGAYRAAADRLQELGSRRAVLAYFSRKDLFWKGLNLKGFVSVDGDYHSTLTWLDLRRELGPVELALQWQQLHHNITPIPGLISPLRRNVQAIVSVRL